MRAFIISIGNELLNGRTANGNAKYIGGRLHDAGVMTEQISSIRDEPDSIKETLAQALNKAGIVIITGGLGPTHDDITKSTLAEYFNSKLILNDSILRKIEDRFRDRGMQMPDINRNQALVPEKARLIPNPVGSAAGLHFEENGRHVLALPGVPREMQAMTDEYIIPLIKAQKTIPHIDVHLYRTTGIAESKLYELSRTLFERHPHFEIAFLPGTVGVDLRIAAKIEEAPDNHSYVEFETELYKRIGKYIFAKGEKELEEILGELLFGRRLSLSVAESCTGGLLQDKITNVAGSSDYFQGGMIAYSNESKMKVLGVRQESLERYGAVSDVVAREMAAGIRQNLGADVGLSTTGIAGPGGGSPEKPVGLIYIGLSTTEKTVARKFLFGSDRLINKARGAQAALELLRRDLLGIDTGAA